MYPVVRDPRTENRLSQKRSYHTGGPHSGKMFGATPVKAQGLSPNGLAKSANPVIPVHKRPAKAGTGVIPMKEKIDLKDSQGKDIGDVSKRQRALSAFKRGQLKRWIIDSGAAFQLVRKGDLPISVQRHIYKSQHPVILVGKRRTTGIWTH